MSITSTLPPVTLSILDPLPLITPTRELRTFTRTELAFLITQGHILILHQHLIYRLNSFLHVHPGGDLPVLHFVGRDATDEIEAYHPAFALKKMRVFVVGRVDEKDWEADDAVGSVGWKPLVPPVHLGWPNNIRDYAGVPTLETSLALLKGYRELGFPTIQQSPLGTTLPYLATSTLEPASPPPSIDPKRQHEISMAWRKFRREILQEEGLFDTNPLQLYKYTIYRCTALFATFAAFYMHATSFWHYAVSATCMGFFMHQIMFVVHDAGHTGVTGNRFWDRAVAGFLASFMSGMSVGWWIDQHDVHHLITNHPEHDPDIQLMPFFAFSTKFFNSIYSTFHGCVLAFDTPTQFLLQYQHYFFYPVMVFARFSLFGKSYHYLLTKAKADGFRTYEMIGVVVFWTWWTLLVKNMGTGMDGWVNRIGFNLIVLLAVCPIHVQIVLSHSAQDSEDVGVYECFVNRQLRTTMDVSCPAWLDWVHGGLQMQITHHLFPRLSRPNLRYASERVKVWAAENGVEFKEMSFTEGNDQMVSMLGEIAGQCRALLHTADNVAKGLVSLDD